VDNFSTGHVGNIEHLLQNPHFELLNHDIVEPLDLEARAELKRFKIAIQGIQEIYHLACPISKKQFEQFKIATVLIHSVGMKNVLDLAVKYQAKLLYGSSSVLYGPRRPDHPFVAETDPSVIDHLTPSGAYDEGKRFSESIVSTYAEVYGLDVKIARLFRIYGPRMKLYDGNLLPDMINAALDGQDIEISAHDDARIGLCYVSDAIDGLLRHMQSPVDVTVVNIGSDQEYRLSAVAQHILELTNNTQNKVRFTAKPMFEAGLPDIGKARQVLHWLPLVRLEDGLRSMIAYARSQRHAQRDFSYVQGL
jgi:UDP-glucuronate decarboxylase